VWQRGKGSLLINTNHPLLLCVTITEGLFRPPTKHSATLIALPIFKWQLLGISTHSKSREVSGAQFIVY